MDLQLLLWSQKISSLGYDTIFLEKPVSNLVEFDYRNILPPPPQNTDPSVKKELILISRETKNRSASDIDLIHKKDQNLDYFFIKLLNKYNLEYPIRFIKEFNKIITPVLLNTKGFWNRPRPSQLAKLYNIKINPIVTDTIHTASYPSGHTVYSSLVALILKDIYPKLSQKELDNIVLDTAQARIMQGVHYPSDNKASLTFSKFVFNKLNLKLKKDYYEQI